MVVSRTILLLRFFFGALLFAPLVGRAEQAKVFFPHLSNPAATVGSGRLAFQAFPGANGLQSFFLNALDIGIGPYLEVGTAPLFYAIEEHKYNFNGKLNFLKLRNLHLGAGYAKFAFRTSSDSPDGTIPVIEDYALTYLVGTANLFLSDSVAVGGTVAKPKLVASSTALAAASSDFGKLEWFVDMPLRLSKKVAFTPGFGVLRVETMNPDSPVPMGYGGTLTWVRKGTGTFGRISVGGHHIPSLAKTKFLFSFSI